MASTTTVVGNIANEIEMKFTNAGKPFCAVTVAVNDRRWNRQTGEMEDGPTWFARGTIWGEFAEHVHQSLGKGSRVIGHGKIVQRNFETKDGEKRNSVEIDFDALGPDLRWATAQVTRASQQGQGGGFGGGLGQGQGDWAQPPANGAQAGAQGFGAGFEPEPF